MADIRSDRASSRRIPLRAVAALALAAGAAVLLVAAATHGPSGTGFVAGGAPGIQCVGDLPNSAGDFHLDCSALTTAPPEPTPTVVPPTTTPGTTPPPTTVPPTTPPPTTVPPTTEPPVTTPPVTTPVTTPPATTPPPTTPPPGPVTHGSQISQTNTGYAAWVGPAGERCTDATMTVYTAKKNATDFPQTTLTARGATCVWFKGGLNVNAAITLTAVRVNGFVRSDGPKLTVNWSTIDGLGTNGDQAVQGHNVDITRSQIFGASDAVRFEAMNLVEDWIRVYRTSAADHNDAIQAYLASAGGSILRCNINGTPTNGGLAGNAAIFLADNSKGTTEIRDNLLAGGGYTLRLHESMLYRVTGNVIVAGSWLYGPLSTTNAVAGAWLEWANNTTSAGTVLTH